MYNLLVFYLPSLENNDETSRYKVCNVPSPCLLGMRAAAAAYLGDVVCDHTSPVLSHVDQLPDARLPLLPVVGLHLLAKRRNSLHGRLIRAHGRHPLGGVRGAGRGRTSRGLIAGHRAAARGRGRERTHTHYK